MSKQDLLCLTAVFLPALSLENRVLSLWNEINLLIHVPCTEVKGNLIISYMSLSYSLTHTTTAPEGGFCSCAHFTDEDMEAQGG